MDTIVEFKNVSKRYNSGEIVVTAVDDVSFTIKKGELVIIVISFTDIFKFYNCIHIILRSYSY